MGLNESDKLPRRITPQGAYKAIYDWYKSNERFLDDIVLDGFKGYKDGFLPLVKHLIEPNNISDIEIKAILIEVIQGSLEPCYHASDSKYKMGAYAHAGLKHYGSIHKLTEEEALILRRSPIRQYLISLEWLDK